MSGGHDDLDPETRQPTKRAGFGATIRAVLWAFFGVRRKSDCRRDATSLDPRAIVVAGLLGGLVFVLVIAAIVRFVVATTR